jgi:cobalt-precorrin-6B (C15)-methyltransferase
MRDDWFIRGNVPMTKEEVRAVSIAKLCLTSGSVLWDLGAGTGSVSVEAALTYPGLRTAAFERNPEALGLVRRNAEKAGLSPARLRIIGGDLPGSLIGELKRTRDGLSPLPDAVFVGGGGAHLGEMLDLLLPACPELRVVVNLIAVESFAAVMEALTRRKIEPEIVNLMVSRAKKAGRFHLMEGMNPVTVLSFGGKREMGDRNER